MKDYREFDETSPESQDDTRELVSGIEEFINTFKNSSNVKELIDSYSSDFMFIPLSTVMARNMFKLYGDEFTKVHLLWMLALNSNYQINNVCVTVSKENLSKLILNRYLDNTPDSEDNYEDIADKKCKIEEFVKEFAGGNTSEEICKTLLEANKIVGTTFDAQTPFVLYRPKDNTESTLYFRRLFSYEQNISSFIKKNKKLLDYVSQDIEKMKEVIKILFPEDSHDKTNWQKVAVASSALSRFSVICGGPGTGKTTTVFKLLTLLCSLNKEGTNRIMLAAPTGKAATRMVESITAQLQKPAAKEEEAKSTYSLLKAVERFSGVDIEALIPKTATTVHSLIKRFPHRESTGFSKDNPLPCDILVVDEISMISVDLFSKLLGAIGKNTRLIMLGDKDQLCSVEPGKVMADICSVLDEKRTSDPKKTKLISELTGYSEDKLLAKKDGRFISSDYVSMLVDSFRFKNDSKLKIFADAVNEASKEEDVVNLLETPSSQGSFSKQLMSNLLDNNESSLFANDSCNDKDTFTSNNKTEVTLDSLDFNEYKQLKDTAQRIAKEAVDFYFGEGTVTDKASGKTEYLNFLIENNFIIKSDKDAKTAFDLLNKFRVLCANRDGVLGTKNLNRIISEKIAKKIILTKELKELENNSKKNEAIDDIFSLGNVILVTKNNWQIGVDNGDIGFVAYTKDSEGNLKKQVFFPPREGEEFRKISPERLSDFELGFAMTIHKSQGSEYQNVCMVLGNKNNRIITKELIYTGLTRAKLISGKDNEPDLGGKVCIVSSRKVLEDGIIRRTERESGLDKMLAE